LSIGLVCVKVDVIPLLEGQFHKYMYKVCQTLKIFCTKHINY